MSALDKIDRKHVDIFSKTLNGPDARLSRPITVYRGIDKSGFNPAVGDLVRLPGFQSTTLSPKIARGFAVTNSEPAMLRIKTSRGLRLEQLSSEGGEAEVLLGHNWNYRVVGRGTTKLKSGKSIQLFDIVVEP